VENPAKKCEGRYYCEKQQKIERKERRR